MEQPEATKKSSSKTYLTTPAPGKVKAGGGWSPGIGGWEFSGKWYIYVIYIYIYTYIYIYIYIHIYIYIYIYIHMYILYIYHIFFTHYDNILPAKNQAFPFWHVLRTNPPTYQIREIEVKYTHLNFPSCDTCDTINCPLVGACWRNPQGLVVGRSLQKSRCLPSQEGLAYLVNHGIFDSWFIMFQGWTRMGPGDVIFFCWVNLSFDWWTAQSAPDKSLVFHQTARLQPPALRREEGIWRCQGVAVFFS